jgi:hypothetical protein
MTSNPVADLGHTPAALGVGDDNAHVDGESFAARKSLAMQRATTVSKRDGAAGRSCRAATADLREGRMIGNVALKAPARCVNTLMAAVA